MLGVIVIISSIMEKNMNNYKVGLFIPCYIDQLYPQIALSTYELLKKLNIDVEYPLSQTCCGQPLYNSGCFNQCQPLAKKFIEIFHTFDYIVAPSGSCIAMVKKNYNKLDKKASSVIDKSYELIEFLHDIIGLEKVNEVINKDLKVKVGIHNSCHAHRELELASSSELNIDTFSKIKNILALNPNIEQKEPTRVDECCGFGGTFSLNEPDVSTQMGNDRIQDHLNNKVTYITAVDISCLMHLQGLIHRQKLNIKTIHIAQLLLGDTNE
jgi:L-lactate dehydrogenase complex protein LldE